MTLLRFDPRMIVDAGPDGPLPLAHFPAGRDARIRVNVATQPDLRTLIVDAWGRGRSFVVATLNLDHLVKLRRDAAFRSAYAAASFVVADGNPVVWLSRLSGRPVSLVPGSELVEPLCDLAAAHGIPIALFGSSQNTLDAAVSRLRADRPDLAVVYAKSPSRAFDPTGPEADAMVAEMAESGAGLCFLALGAPKQEILAAQALHRVPRCGFVCVGAGLDFIAGTQRRAPFIVRRLSLEWLWRMLNDPRRLSRRYAACALLVPMLVADALRQRVASRRHATLETT